MTSEYLVVLSIDDIPDGQIYSAKETLPLHCTLMHWFTLDQGLPLGELDVELSNLAITMGGTLQLITDERKLFGPHNDVPVWTLKRTDELLLLHTRLFAFLAQYESLSKDLRWIGAGWSPHITIVNGWSVRRSERFVAKHMALIERGENKVKLVHAVYPLG